MEGDGKMWRLLLAAPTRGCIKLRLIRAFCKTIQKRMFKKLQNQHMIDQLLFYFCVVLAIYKLFSNLYSLNKLNMIENM